MALWVGGMRMVRLRTSFNMLMLNYIVSVVSTTLHTGALSQGG